MKSLAYVLTGIALIAFVVPVAPVQYVLAQSGTFSNHYCNVTQEAHVYPAHIYCDKMVPYKKRAKTGTRKERKCLCFKGNNFWGWHR